MAAPAALGVHRPAAAAVERARLLGLPAAVLGEAAPGPPVTRPHGPRGRPSGRLLVVDMSSMWAGPLCGQLLRRCGCHRDRGGKPSPPRWHQGRICRLLRLGEPRKTVVGTVEFDDHAAMLRLLGSGRCRDRGITARGAHPPWPRAG